jgi:hypothetical protein
MEQKLRSIDSSPFYQSDSEEIGLSEEEDEQTELEAINLIKKQATEIRMLKEQMSRSQL